MSRFVELIPYLTGREDDDYALFNLIGKDDGIIQEDFYLHHKYVSLYNFAKDLRIVDPNNPIPKLDNNIEYFDDGTINKIHAIRFNVDKDSNITRFEYVEIALDCFAKFIIGYDESDVRYLYDIADEFKFIRPVLRDILNRLKSYLD